MQDPFELDRVLLERRDDAGLAALRAGEDEVQCQQRLSDPGRSGDQGRCASPVAVGKHRVQRGHSGGHALRCRRRSCRLVDRIGQRGNTSSPLRERRYVCLPVRKPLPRSLRTCRTRISRSATAVGAQRHDGVGDGELRRIHRVCARRTRRPRTR